MDDNAEYTDDEVALNLVKYSLQVTEEEFNELPQDTQELALQEMKEWMRVDRKRGAITRTVAETMRPDLFNGKYEEHLKKSATLDLSEISRMVEDAQLDFMDEVCIWQEAFEKQTSKMAIEEAALDLERDSGNLRRVAEEYDTEDEEYAISSFNEGISESVERLRELSKKLSD